jgi:MoaA/NifB/PqqE/SkfB family radical SAM enzyme
MRKVPMSQSLRIIAQGSSNWLVQRPIVVSFEVTDSCTCHCRHCDHGGMKDDIKQANGLPYILLVSSWSLMTVERYKRLREVGVDQFSVSLDFPDSRHDEFRAYPGLYDHLNEVIPQCAALGHDDIVLNTCITAANLEAINSNADQAEKWGVNICYSAYSARRTGCRELFPGSPEQLQRLYAELDRVEQRRTESNWIVSAPTTLQHTREYFTRGGAPGCKAGLRFLVVTAKGMLQPCSMQFEQYALTDQGRMVDQFTAHNTCDECYVAIRSNLDKSFPQLLGENVARYFSFGSAKNGSGNGNGASGGC